MPEFTKNLTYTEKRWGVLLVPIDSRRLFPLYSHPITITDDGDGEQFFLRMHKTLSRIDGLTRLYAKHHGSMITVEVKDDDSGIAGIRFQEVAFYHLVTWPEALRDYINLTDMLGSKYGKKMGPAGSVLTVIDDRRRKFEMKRHGGNQLTRCTDCFRSNNIETNSKIELWLDFGEMDNGKGVLHLSKLF